VDGRNDSERGCPKYVPEEQNLSCMTGNSQSHSERVYAHEGEVAGVELEEGVTTRQCKTKKKPVVVGVRVFYLTV